MYNFLQDPDRHNDFLRTLDDGREFISTIRAKAGVDRGKSLRAHRASDASYNLMSGSSLLRKSSFAEGMQSKVAWCLSCVFYLI